jgi:SAM-dependent methyltransferase
MSAVAETAGLLKQDQRVNLDDAYLDVLGERDAIGPHRNQQVFRSKLVPKIYESIWRPLVARCLFGLAGPRFGEERRLVLAMAGVEPGARVLDVGCGTGNYTRWLAQAADGGLTVGLDASESMVAAAAARDRDANIAYLRGDANALPFEDGSFDVACSVGAIHLLEEPLQALGEMVRVLAPGGRLLVAVTCVPRESRKRRRGGVVMFGRDEVTGALREHGLQGIEQKVVGRGQFVAAQKPAKEVRNGR